MHYYPYSIHTLSETALTQNNNKKNIQNVCSVNLSRWLHSILNNISRKLIPALKYKQKCSSLFFFITIIHILLSRIKSYYSAGRSNRCVWSFSSFFSSCDRNRNYYRFSFFTPARHANYTGELMVGNIGRWRGVSTNYPVLTLRIRNSTMTSNLIRASPFVACNNRSPRIVQKPYVKPVEAGTKWLV